MFFFIEIRVFINCILIKQLSSDLSNLNLTDFYTEKNVRYIIIDKLLDEVYCSIGIINLFNYIRYLYNLHR